jgi:hypothetical protein
MILPKFTVKLNKALDQQCFIKFFQEKNPLIFEHYPFLKSENDVKKLIKYMYKNKIDEIEDTEKYILSKQDSLEKVARQLAEIVGTDWEGIENINVIPAICPVCPRFIESNSFLVTYFYNKDAIFRICAHEMLHFIFFKKLKLLFPNETIDTGFPGKDWLLSEIVAPLIINSDDLQQYVSQKDEFYAPIEIKNIDQLQKQIGSEYKNRNNFDDFIFKARTLVLSNTKKSKN